MTKTPGAQSLLLFDPNDLVETSQVEYKLAKGGLPNSLWTTYSSFANTDGGTIYLGVEEKSGVLSVVGVENASKLITDFWNIINGNQKVSANLLLNDDVFVETLEDFDNKQVVVINVPRATQSQRPVYVGKDPFAGTYRRIHSSDQLCTHNEVQRMLADQLPRSNDSRILTGYSMSDLDAESIRQYRQLFNSRQTHPWSLLSDQDFLRKLQAWRTDRETNQEGLTVAGLLMFGAHDALLDSQNGLHYSLDFRLRRSDQIGERWDDRFTLDGTWAGNLFQFYQLVFPKLTSGLSIPFETDSNFVRKATTPVHEALQEGFVNALIHADYSCRGGTVIERFVDKFVFSNAGTLLVSLQQMRAGGVSECRNPAVQKMFGHVGFGDAAGSGLDKIRASWWARQWSSPELHTQLHPDRVILTLPMVSALPPAAIEELTDRFGNLAELGVEEMSVLVYALIRNGVSNSDLQSDLTLHRADITRLLQGLRKRGYLEQDGFGRKARYTLKERNSSPLHADSSPLHADSSPLHADSSPLHADSSPLHADSSPLHADSSPLQADSTIAAARLHKSKRAIVETDALILDFCVGNFRTPKEIAEYLKRSPAKIRAKFLSRLVSAGKLELKHPKSLNHPVQGYRTVQNES